MAWDDGNGGIVRAPARAVTVKVDPSEVRSIANAHVAAAKDRVEAALNAFRNTPDGGGAFGGSEAAAQLASLHSSVKTVFTETVTGVTTDLTTYHQNLIAAANAWEASEDASATRSQALVERLTAAASAPLATAASFDGSRRAQGEALGLGDTLSAHAGEGDTAETGEAAEVPEGEEIPGDETDGVAAPELPVDPPGVADPAVPSAPATGGR